MAGDGSESASEEDLKVDEELLGRYECISFFRDQPATRLLLGGEVNAENLMLRSFRSHGLRRRLNPEGNTIGTERAIPGTYAYSLDWGFTKGGVTSDKIGRTVRPDTDFGYYGKGTKVIERCGERFLLVF